MIYYLSDRDDRKIIKHIVTRPSKGASWSAFFRKVVPTSTVQPRTGGKVTNNGVHTVKKSTEKATKGETKAPMELENF